MKLLLFIVLSFSHFFVSTDVQLLKNYVRNSADYYTNSARQIPSKANKSLGNIKRRFDWISPKDIGNDLVSEAILFLIKCFLLYFGISKMIERCFKKEKYFKNKEPPKELSIGNTYNSYHFEYKGCDKSCKKCKTKKHSISNATKISEVLRGKYIIVIYKIDDDIRVR